MEESLLIKISLGCILIGLPLLWLLGFSIENRDNLIEKDMIKFEGEIVSVDKKEEVTFLTVVPSTGFKVIIFDAVDFEPGEIVSISGTLDWYEGNMEIIGERVITE